MSKLYIIGNGFDLYHDLPSSYTKFGEYIKEHDNDVFEAIEEYIFSSEPTPELWKNFEESLGHFNDDELREFAKTYLMDYGSEEWRDSAHHDYQYMINEVVKGLTDNLYKHLAAWALELDKVTPNNNRLSLDKEAKYLSFNYTHTIENLYAPTGEILHIHGSIEDANSQLVLGHGTAPAPHRTEDEIKNSMDEDSYIEYCEERAGEDPRVYEGENIIRGYWEESYKNTQQIIADNQTFFNDLQEVTEIHVIGLSFSSVDLNYIEEINKKVPDAKWIVCYHASNEEKEFKDILINDLGIKEGNIELKRL